MIEKFLGSIAAFVRCFFDGAVLGVRAGAVQVCMYGNQLAGTANTWEVPRSSGVDRSQT